MENALNVMDIGSGNYVLVSENRVNFVSGVDSQDLKELLKEESEIIKSSFEDGEVSSGLGPSISFMPTLDCNLRCIYCYAKGGDDKIYLDISLVKMALRNLAKTRKDSADDILSIYFVGGGEPFMNFSCIEEVCNYSKKLFKLYTNTSSPGSLLFHCTHYRRYRIIHKIT